MAVVDQMRGNTARSIAGDFSFRAIGIDEAYAHVSALRGKEPLHAVGPNAVVAVADLFAELERVHGRKSAIHDQEVVAARRCFREWDQYLFSVSLLSFHAGSTFKVMHIFCLAKPLGK